MTTEQFFLYSTVILIIAILVAGALHLKISLVVRKIKAVQERQARRTHPDTRASKRLQHLNDRLAKLTTYQKSIKWLLALLFVILATATNLAAT